MKILFLAAVLVILSYARHYPSLGLLAILLDLVALCLALRAWFKRGVSLRLKLQWSFIIVALPVMWVAFIEPYRFGYWQDRLFIRMNPGKMSSCVTHGVKFGENQILALCDADTQTWRWGATKALIYDSSGQILLAPEQRSSEWSCAALALNDKEGVPAPFGVAGYAAEHLTGNFYLVLFDAGSIAKWDIGLLDWSGTKRCGEKLH